MIVNKMNRKIIISNYNYNYKLFVRVIHFIAIVYKQTQIWRVFIQSSNFSQESSFKLIVDIFFFFINKDFEKNKRSEPRSVANRNNVSSHKRQGYLYYMCL